VPHKFTVHGLQLGVLLLVDFVIELLEKLKKLPGTSGKLRIL